jgi:hypothetical protein
LLQFPAATSGYQSETALQSGNLPAFALPGFGAVHHAIIPEKNRRDDGMVNQNSTFSSPF